MNDFTDHTLRVDSFGQLVNMFQHAWFNQTTVHPLGLLAVTILGLASLIVSRRYALVPILAMAAFISPAQRLVVLTLDFDFLRIMVLAGLLRIVIRGEYFLHRWKPLDTAMVVWSAVGTLMYILLKSDFSATVRMIGFSFDALGIYFMCRMLIRDWDDIALITKYVVYISFPVMAAFLWEKSTGRNLFAIFGGVPEFTDVRQGRLRVQGAFAHPIIAGAFWATLIPFALALYRQRMRSRWLTPLAAISFTLIIVSTASTTPIGTAALCVLMMCLYPLRRMRSILKWGVIAGALGLELVMNHHIWHLFTYIDFVGGSTGWYRYYLIQVFLTNFSEWWLMGTNEFHQWGNWDIIGGVTNQYIWQGINGGLVTLLAFLGIIFVAASAVSSLLRTTEGDRAKNLLAWAMGVALLTHCVTFLGTNYFGQVVLVWYMLLAMIGSMHALEAQRASARATNTRTGRPRFRLPVPEFRPQPALRLDPTPEQADPSTRTTFA